MNVIIAEEAMKKTDEAIKRNKKSYGILCDIYEKINECALLGKSVIDYYCNDILDESTLKEVTYDLKMNGYSIKHIIRENISWGYGLGLPIHSPSVSVLTISW